MFLNIFSIELKKNLRSPSFYIFSFVFFFSTLLFVMNTDPNTIFMGINFGKEFHNAPIHISQLLARLSVIGLLFTMVIIGRAVAKDFEVNIHELVFTRPITKFQYLGGRFFGSFLANLLIFLSVFLAFELGRLIMEAKYFGPFRIMAYLRPLVINLIPNILLIGSMFFALATLSRKMISTYIIGVAFLAIYAEIGFILHSTDSETLKILLDPFGINGLTVMTKFWTVSDMNNLLVPLEPVYIINRVFWFSISILILYFTYKKFEFRAILEKKNKKEQVKKEVMEIKDYQIQRPNFKIATNKMFSFKQCLSISWKEFKRIVIHPAFLILLVLALSQIVVNFIGDLGNSSGSRYPFTSWYIGKTFHLWMYMLPMMIFFGGMLVWREKDHQGNEIMNTMPIPNWLAYVSKLLTLVKINALYLFLAIITGIFVQVVIMDFHDVEIGLYIKQFFGIDFLNYLHMAIIVLFIQNLSPNKYIGFFLSALYFITDLIIFDAFGFDNYLLRIGRIPNYIYSNMNGFGHFAPTIIWYSIYWIFFSGLVAWLTILLWRRTNENSLKIRFNYLKKNVTLDQKKGLLIIAVLFFLTGSFIAYNKYIVNPYYSKNDYKQMQADYEKNFSKYLNVVQPGIKDIYLNVDLFPKSRHVKINGSYLLYNHTKSEIKEIFLNLNDWNLENFKPFKFSQKCTEKLHADQFGFRIFELNQPLKVGDSLLLSFDYEIVAQGFSDNYPKNQIAENGISLFLTSFHSAYFPLIGYNINAELVSDKDREEFGLSPKPDAPKIQDADRTVPIFAVSRPNYEAVISTSSNQTAISGGELLKKWSKNGRNYFQYKTDHIIENEIPILSARYEVKSEIYKDVKVEVYYHPKHNYNIDRILDGLKDSYDYGNKYFSKYPYGNLRVVEIPDYMSEGTARHFPTTFVWIESEGFITKYDEDDIDIVYGIAAHENAHHWWAGIVTAARAEGAFMLTETICQYTMAMLTEKKYGEKIARKYNKREMRSYLLRRKKDTEGEKPLIESSVQQSYLGYKKSSVVMYALQDYLSEDSVGIALGRIVDKFEFRLDSFPLASDLLNEFNKVCPDSLKYLVSDLFEKITLYENKIDTIDYESLTNGKYLVKLQVSTAKFYADSVGNQRTSKLKDYIYVGLLDENDDAIYYKKHLFTKNQTTIEIECDKLPVKAGIDPYFLMIDRDLDNNIVKINRNREIETKLTRIIKQNNF